MSVLFLVPGAFQLITSVLDEWSDHARDTLNFLFNYLPDRVEGGQIEHNLPQISPQSVQQRRQRGFTHRTIVGIGHSFGGCVM